MLQTTCYHYNRQKQAATITNNNMSSVYYHRQKLECRVSALFPSYSTLRRLEQIKPVVNLPYHYRAPIVLQGQEGTPEKLLGRPV
jgi:hypothetical protein